MIRELLPAFARVSAGQGSNRIEPLLRT